MHPDDKTYGGIALTIRSDIKYYEIEYEVPKRILVSY